jgi:hypothetical protein
MRRSCCAGLQHELRMRVSLAVLQYARDNARRHIAPNMLIISAPGCQRSGNATRVETRQGRASQQRTTTVARAHIVARSRLARFWQRRADTPPAMYRTRP